MKDLNVPLLHTDIYIWRCRNDSILYIAIINGFRYPSNDNFVPSTMLSQEVLLWLKVKYFLFNFLEFFPTKAFDDVWYLVFEVRIAGIDAINNFLLWFCQIILSYNKAVNYFRLSIIIMLHFLIKPFVPNAPMHTFSTTWKHQKTLRFSDVFRG